MQTGLFSLFEGSHLLLFCLLQEGISSLEKEEEGIF